MPTASAAARAQQPRAVVPPAGTQSCVTCGRLFLRMTNRWTVPRAPGAVDHSSSTEPTMSRERFRCDARFTRFVAVVNVLR